MGWLTYALIGVFSFAVFYLLQRVFLKEKGSDPISYAIIFNFICAILISIVAIMQGFVLPELKTYTFNLVLMTIVYTASQVLIFKASQSIGASELIIFSATRALWTILVALLFLGESLSLSKIIGTILILFSVGYISVKKVGIKLKPGHIYALAAAFCIGIGFANDSFVLRSSDAFTYGALAFILPGILTVVIFPSATMKIGSFLSLGTLTKILLLGIFYSIGFVSLYLAYQSGGNAAQIAPVGQSVVVVTIILAAIFLGERDNLFKKFISAVLVSIGVLLLK